MTYSVDTFKLLVTKRKAELRDEGQNGAYEGEKGVIEGLKEVGYERRHLGGFEKILVERENENERKTGKGEDSGDDGDRNAYKDVYLPEGVSEIGRYEDSESEEEVERKRERGRNKNMTSLKKELDRKVGGSLSPGDRMNVSLKVLF